MGDEWLWLGLMAVVCVNLCDGIYVGPRLTTDAQ